MMRRLERTCRVAVKKEKTINNDEGGQENVTNKRERTIGGNEEALTRPY